MNKIFIATLFSVVAVVSADSMQDRVERLQRRFNTVKKERIRDVTDGIMQKRDALAKHVLEMSKDCPTKDCEKGLAYVEKVMRTDRAREFVEEYVKENVIDVEKVVKHQGGSALSQEQQDEFDSRVVHPLMSLGTKKMLWIAVDAAVKGQRGREFREKMQKEHAAVFGGILRWEDLGKNEQQRQMRDGIVQQFQILRVADNEQYEKEMAHLYEVNETFAQELSKAVDFEYKSEKTIDALKLLLKQFGVDANAEEKSSDSSGSKKFNPTKK